MSAAMPRSGDVAALLRVGQHLLEAPLAVAVPEVLRLLTAHLGADGVSCAVPGRELTLGRVPVATEPVDLLTPRGAPGVARATIALRAQGIAVGELTVLRGTPLTLEEEQLCHAVADLLALAVSADRARADVVDAVESERARLAGELHDTVVQDLVAARYAIDLQGRVADDGSAGSVDVRGIVQGALAEARRTMWRLRPRIPAQGGLPAALASLAAHLAEAPDGPQLRLDLDASAAFLPLAQATVAYRLVQAAAAAVDGGTVLAVLRPVGIGSRLEVSVDGDLERTHEVEEWLHRAQLVGLAAACGRGALTVAFPARAEQVEVEATP